VCYVKAKKGGQIDLGNCGLISGAFSEQSAHSGGIDLTTKGDMHGYSSSNARIPIGDDNQILTADSAQALGLKWAAAAAGGSLELLDVHTATGTESSYTFTQDLDKSNYSNFDIIFQGDATAELALLMQVNGSTSSNHHYTLIYSDGSSITDSWVEDSTSFPLISTNLNSTNPHALYASCQLRTNVVGEQYLIYTSFAHAYPQLRWEEYVGIDSGITTGDISSIKIFTSTSTWLSGTRISTYGWETT